MTAKFQEYAHDPLLTPKKPKPAGPTRDLTLSSKIGPNALKLRQLLKDKEEMNDEG